MRPLSYKKYLLVFLALLLLLSLPTFFVEKMREQVVTLGSPLWRGILKVKAPLIKSKSAVEKARLEAENELLRAEVKRLKVLVEPKTLALLEKGALISSRIIYRDAASFSSSFWINVGSETHQSVCKNSPVLFGRSLVGVVDYVGKKQSRVRLLTDSALRPSVKSSKCSLAKGVLQGSGAPLWRSRGSKLVGTGFCYEGCEQKGSTIVPGDLLVTSGLDGVFPAGLKVAEVTKVLPLREGAYTYEIEAKPTVGNMEDLHTVFILPPLGFNAKEQEP